LNKQQVKQAINTAKIHCTDSGGRLTEKRQKILKMLLVSNRPLSAYEIKDIYNENAIKAMPAMSVYRILEFLEMKNLIHKLNSNSKYLACSHLTFGHKHNSPQFLICTQCESVKEVVLSNALVSELNSLVGNSGYTLTQPKLELECICNSCSEERQLELML